MANSSKLPTTAQFAYFDWQNAFFQRSPQVDGSGTYTLYFTVTPTDSDGNIIDGGFLVTSFARNGKTYTYWVPVGNVSVDGLSATGCVGGIRPTGYDYTTGDADFLPPSTVSLAGAKIVCGLPAVVGELLRQAVQGNIATGGSRFIIGTDASGDVTLAGSTGTGTYSDFIKRTSAGVAQYWNGSSWVAFNDAVASVTAKVSATDTTPDYLQNKFGSSDGSVVFSVTNPGGDETLNLAVNIPARISSHAIYTPAYMTGGTSAETNTALWDSVTNGSFRLTIDGVTLNVTGISFAGITTMAQVATVIQTALRAACGTTPTVVWSTNKFIITSSNTTVSSAVSVLTTSTASVGTDISGAGAGTWMDSESGRGTATAAVLDPTQDSGKVGLLNARGSFPADLARDIIDKDGYQAKGDLMAASASNAPARLAAGANDFGLRTDSSQSTGLKWAPTSKILATLAGAVTVSNTTTETNLLSLTLPANVLSTTNVIEIDVLLSAITAVAGVTNDLFLRFKYGGTTIATLTIADGTVSSLNGKLKCYLIAGATSNAQVGWMDGTFQKYGSDEVPSAGTVTPKDSSGTDGVFTAYVQNNGTAAIDSTSAQTLSLTAQWGAADAGNSVTALYGVVKLIA